MKKTLYSLIAGIMLLAPISTQASSNVELWDAFQPYISPHVIWGELSTVAEHTFNNTKALVTTSPMACALSAVAFGVCYFVWESPESETKKEKGKMHCAWKSILSHMSQTQNFTFGLFFMSVSGRCALHALANNVDSSRIAELFAEARKFITDETINAAIERTVSTQ